MRDLGLDPRGKSSLFEEWFDPYRPRDYRGLIQEYLAVHPQVVPLGKKTEKKITTQGNVRKQACQ